MALGAGGAFAGGGRRLVALRLRVDERGEQRVRRARVVVAFFERSGEHQRTHPLGGETHRGKEGLAHPLAALRAGRHARGLFGEIEQRGEHVRGERTREILFVRLQHDLRRRRGIESREHRDERRARAFGVFERVGVRVGHQHDDVGRLEQVATTSQQARLARDAHELAAHATAFEVAAFEVAPVEELGAPSGAPRRRERAATLEQERLVQHAHVGGLPRFGSAVVHDADHEIAGALVDVRHRSSASRGGQTPAA